MARKSIRITCDKGKRGSLSCMIMVKGKVYGCMLKRKRATQNWVMDYCNVM